MQVAKLHVLLPFFPDQLIVLKSLQREITGVDIGRELSRFHAILPNSEHVFSPSLEQVQVHSKSSLRAIVNLRSWHAKGRFLLARSSLSSVLGGLNRRLRCCEQHVLLQVKVRLSKGSPLLPQQGFHFSERRRNGWMCTLPVCHLPASPEGVFSERGL